MLTEPTDQEMNALQDAGLISDLCVHWADVAECDRARALEYIAMFKVATPVELL